MKEVSKKEIFIWNILGSFCNAVISVLFLAVVTRLTSTEESDAFSLAWSIAQLLLTVGTFQVRLYQATDVKGKYSFKQYVWFRFSTIAVMGVLSVGYIIYYHYTGLKASVILMLSVYKAIEALSDVFQGWFQQKERLDLAGKSLSARVVMSLCIFTATLIIWRRLLWSCLSMIVVSVVCIVLFDLRYICLEGMGIKTEKTREKNWWFKLFVTCFPLFINSFLVMSIFNASKMAIDNAISSGVMQQGMQTVYNIIFMPTSVINLMYIVFRPVITNMAIEWNNDNFKEYLKLIKQIVLQLLGASVLILGMGYFLGIPVLSLLYGIDLNEAKMALMVLLFAGGLNTLVNVLDNALTVIRKQYYLVIAYVITWIYSLATASKFVYKWGINGAAVSFMTSMALLLGVVLILFKYSYTAAKKEKLQNKN